MLQHNISFSIYFDYEVRKYVCERVWLCWFFELEIEQKGIEQNNFILLLEFSLDSFCNYISAWKKWGPLPLDCYMASGYHTFVS